MDLRAELLSVLVRYLQDVDLVGLSCPLSEPNFASLLLCLLVPLFFPFSLLTVVWTSFYIQGDTTVAKLHA
jgi:hypothetical protein